MCYGFLYFCWHSLIAYFCHNTMDSSINCWSLICLKFNQWWGTLRGMLLAIIKGNQWFLLRIFVFGPLIFMKICRDIRVTLLFYNTRILSEIDFLRIWKWLSLRDELRLIGSRCKEAFVLFITGGRISLYSSISVLTIERNSIN